MKLLVVSNLYPPEVHGGYELICADVVRCLRRSGHEVTVLTSGPTRGSRRCLRWLQLTRPFCEPPPRWWPSVPLASVDSRWQTERALEQVRPDGALVFSLRRVGLGPLDALDEAGIPAVYVLNDEHLEAFRPAPWRWSVRGGARVLLERTLLRSLVEPRRRAFRPIALSHYMADRLVEGGTVEPPVQVVPQGIPVERFPLKEEPGRLHTPVRLLYSGRLHPDKGVHTLLEAVRLLEQRDVAVQVTVLGGGAAAYRQQLRRLAGRCESVIAFEDWIARDAVGPLLRRHDILVFPSIWQEPFGLSHLEAMASGTPVVSTDVGGCRDLVEHRVNSLRFSPGVASELADAVHELVQRPQLAHEMALRARLQVEQKYDVARYAEQLVEGLG